MDENLLTVVEVAARLKVKRRTVQAWCESGRLRAYRLAGRLWRVPEPALAELLVGNEPPRRERSPNAAAEYREVCERLKRRGVMA